MRLPLAILSASLSIAAVACVEPLVPGDLPPRDLTAVYDFSRPVDFSPPPDQPPGADIFARDGSESPDLAGPDLASPDLAAPDLASPDLASPPDLLVRELAMPDLGGADLAAPDLAVATPDLAVAPPDLAARDLTACDAVCDTPPPARCERNVVRTFTRPGACQGGACLYPSTTTTCPIGCWAAACVAAQLGFLGNTKAFETDVRPLDLTIVESVSAAGTVSVTTETWPQGTVGDLRVYYWLGTDSANQRELPMLFDRTAGNNEQWYAILPAQAAGTRVTWYLKATGYDGKVLYDSRNGANFVYTTR